MGLIHCKETVSVFGVSFLEEQVRQSQSLTALEAADGGSRS